MTFLRWLAMRSFVVTLTVNQAIGPLIGLAVWSAALGRGGRAPFASYYTMLLLVQLLTVSYESHTFSVRIYNGELADDLLRPYPAVVQPLGENLALRAWHGIMGLPLVLGLLLVVPVTLDPRFLALSLPALLLAGTLRFLFTYTLSLAAFWTQQAGGAVSLGWTLVFLLGGGAAPPQLMPGPLHTLVEALPFRAMLGFPAEVGTGWLSSGAVLAGFGLQALWVLLFLSLAAWVWRRGVRSYTAVGG
jgi:ABC-2 type transport system permease protein